MRMRSLKLLSANANLGGDVCYHRSKTCLSYYNNKPNNPQMTELTWIDE